VHETALDSRPAEKRTRSPVRLSLPLIVLTVALLASAACLVFSLHRSRPWVEAGLKEMRVDPEFVEGKMRGDPRLGAMVSLRELRDGRARPRPVDTRAQHLAVLFVAGPKLTKCPMCGVADFIGKFDELARAHPDLAIYVIWAGQADLKGSVFDPTAYSRNLHFGVDPQLALAKNFNAFFFPRGYLLSGKGELRYAAPFGVEAKDVVAAMRALLPKAAPAHGKERT